MTVHRTLFIGDLEAQYRICRNELELSLLPAVSDVISLGNLVSCSDLAADDVELGRNEAVLTFWDRISIPKTRLIGRNEIAALNFPRQWTNNLSNNFLRDGWLSEEPTFVVATVNKGRLVTSAGLTHGLWQEIGRPETAEEAAKILNEMYFQTMYQGPSFLIEGKPNLSANPIWADAVLELYPSWILAEDKCPFDQIHGADSLNSKRARAMIAEEDHPLHYVDKVSFRKFGSLAHINGASFRGIDLDLVPMSLTSLPADKAFYIEETAV